MEIILTTAYCILFSFIILKWKWFEDDYIKKHVFIILFILKVGAGIFAGQLYLEKYNGGDTYSFFKDSKVITQTASRNREIFFLLLTGLHEKEHFAPYYKRMKTWNNEDIVYNDNKTIIRFHAFIGLFSKGFYFVHVVFFAFISLLGLNGIYKAARILCKQNAYLVLAAVFLVPGVIFWFSVASKESILIFAMGLFFYHCMRLLTVSKSMVNMAGMFMAGILFIHIKAYLLVLITPCLLAFTWVSVTNGKYSLLKYLLIYIPCIIFFFSISNLIDGFDPLQILVMKRYNFESFVDYFQNVGSYIQLPEITADWQSIILSAPKAFLIVLTRPFPWESSNLLIIASAIENILIIAILIWGCIKINWSAILKNSNFLLFCLFFTISLFVLIGLTSPSLGAIVRYKVPALPFLCLIPLLISEKTDNNEFIP
jgi:hypothetical protein